MAEERDSATWPELEAAGSLPQADAVPEGFPTARFILPDDAVVHDAGKRSDSEWFVVLRAADQTAAESTWLSIIEASGLVVDTEEPTTGAGVSAELSNVNLAVLALTIPQDDGSVLLSYDVTVLG